MFGLWFSLAGLFSGFICSYIAKQKDRANKDWFMLGFIIPFLALGIIYFLPSAKKEKDNIKSTELFDEDYGFSANV